MYKLFDEVSEKDFIWVQCNDSFEQIKVVEVFVKKGYTSFLKERDYNFLPHIIVNLVDKIILPCGASMAVCLKSNGVKWKYGEEFLDCRIC